MSFGQSFQVTPIQMAATVSALVNGGKRVTPHFGVRILDKDKETVRELEYDDGKQIVSEETSRTMQALLEVLCQRDPGKMQRSKDTILVERQLRLRRFQEVRISIFLLL